MTTEKKTRGPGRVAEDGATGLKNVSIALTDEQRAWLRRNRGSLAARAWINSELEKERKEKRATKARQ